MKTEAEVRQALRDWIVKASGKIAPGDFDDQTPILEKRIITSVKIMDLILFLENLTGNRPDVTKLKVGVFRNVDAIYRNFCEVKDAS